MEKEEITQLTEEMLAETEGLKAQLNSETTKRKKLHNQLVNLRGAIRVFCRVRPMLDAAGEHIEGTVSTEVDDTTDSISVVGNRANAYKPQEIKQKKFSFDRVFAMDSSQEAIYDETSAVVTSVMDGYNVCIFAYGQTGSGKTFTMEGSEDSRGVNYRTLGELFELAKFRRSQMQYSFNVSLVEVYNEEVRDLLADHTTEVTWNSHNKVRADSGSFRRRHC
jgi:kinesin family protein C2/C3